MPPKPRQADANVHCVTVCPHYGSLMVVLEKSFAVALPVYPVDPHACRPGIVCAHHRPPTAHWKSLRADGPDAVSQGTELVGRNQKAESKRAQE